MVRKSRKARRARKFRMIWLSIALFVTAAIAAGVALGSPMHASKNKPKPGTQVIFKNTCKNGQELHRFKGDYVIHVSSSGCVAVDSGTLTIASGNATVLAHGSASIRARGNVTLVVYNQSVSCIVTKSVTVISQSYDGFDGMPNFLGCTVAGK